ncbi:MAG: citrate transporter [Spirochaetia bacterium]|nr:citrate transporter [Spirochaetia bacterium]MBR0318748.1 citrate transporter [Spirochaetia bacterium]
MWAQISAILIFVIMFAFIISEKFERHYISMVSAAATLIIVFGFCMHSMDSVWTALSLDSMLVKSFWYAKGVEADINIGVNWATIIFIAGMMIMVEGMARTGFFAWLCMWIAKIVHYRVIPIFIAFMLLSALLSMFIDSITVILFLAAITVELSYRLGFNPIPMILPEIFCASIGGSATMCGDPPNIIIGTSLGYTFGDFLDNTGAMAGLSLVAVMVFFYFAFRKELAVKTASVDPTKFPRPESVIKSFRGFVFSIITFLCAVVLLVTHAQTGLTVPAIGVIISAITFLAAPKYIPYILKRVDYKTLLFFIGLFVVISGLELTGVLGIIAKGIKTISGGNPYLMIGIVMWVSGIASAFVDNIPFTATMIPVIESLAATTGVSMHTLAWTLSMGTDVGGCATPIGASANVVGTSICAKSDHPISWGRYCKWLAPASVLAMGICTVYIFIVYL